MTEIVNFGDILVNYFNQEKTLQETAADLGAIIFEIDREKKYYGEHTQRMAELKKLAAVQDRVVSKMMDRIDGSATHPEVPHLEVFNNPHS
jgi:hypothetical protein